MYGEKGDQSINQLTNQSIRLVYL